MVILKIVSSRGRRFLCFIRRQGSWGREERQHGARTVFWQLIPRSEERRFTEFSPRTGVCCVLSHGAAHDSGCPVSATPINTPYLPGTWVSISRLYPNSLKPNLWSSTIYRDTSWGQRGICTENKVTDCCVQGPSN